MPAAQATPAVSMTSSTMNGMPCSGPSRSPRAMASSAARAWARAASHSSTTALSGGLTSAIRARWASTTSAADAWRSRIARASPTAGRLVNASIAPVRWIGSAAGIHRARGSARTARRRRCARGRPGGLLAELDHQRVAHQAGARKCRADERLERVRCCLHSAAVHGDHDGRDVVAGLALERQLHEPVRDHAVGHWSRRPIRSVSIPYAVVVGSGSRELTVRPPGKTSAS